MDMTQAIDFLVKTENPERLDDTLQQLPGMHAFVVGRGMPGGCMQRDGCYVVRVFGPTNWFEYAVMQQGYCTIVKKLDKLV